MTGYLPAGNDYLPLQASSWEMVFERFNAVLNNCVRQKMPGYLVLSENLLVAFWARGSSVDQQYGIHSLLGNGTGARNRTGMIEDTPDEPGVILF